MRRSLAISVIGVVVLIVLLVWNILGFKQQRASIFDLKQPKPIQNSQSPSRNEVPPLPKKELVGQDAKMDPDAKPFIDRVERMRANFRKVAAKYGLTKSEPDKLILQEVFVGPVVAIYATTGEYSFGYNRELKDWRTYPDTSQKNEGGIPVPWTNDHAIEVGKAFIEAMLDRKSVLLDSYLASTQNGEWSVGAQRVDSEGHVFFKEGVSLNFPQGGQPSAGRIDLYSSSDVMRTGTALISRDEAFAIAQKVFAGENYGAGFQVSPYDPRLPGDNLSPKPYVALGRLMWIFGVSNSQYFTRDIYIDAYTGEYAESLSY